MGFFKNTTTTSATGKIVETNSNKNNIKKTVSSKKLPKPVYYVRSDKDNTVLVGINVIVRQVKMGERDFFEISWYDTSHERMMTASETRYKDDLFAFRRIEQEGGGFYYFIPMNLQIYNNRVKKRLVDGGDFTNDADLEQAFLDTLQD